MLYYNLQGSLHQSHSKQINTDPTSIEGSNLECYRWAWTTSKEAKSFWALTFDLLLLKLCHFTFDSLLLNNLRMQLLIRHLLVSFFFWTHSGLFTYQALKFECLEHLLLASFLCRETPSTKTRNLLPLLAIHKLENVQTCTISNIKKYMASTESTQE